MPGLVNSVFVMPRMLPRRWGRSELRDWCAGAPRPDLPIGEVWTIHPANMTDCGVHLGVCLSASPEDMLGNLGQAPPSVRLILSGEPTEPITSHESFAAWRVLEAPLDAGLTIVGAQPRDRRTKSRCGDLFRIEGGAGVVLDAEVAALEVRPSFVPTNHVAPSMRVRRLVAQREDRERQVWLRDPALTVEAWTLPERSYIEPDGETCHVLTALTAGVALDGRVLARGESVFVPANGRRALLTGRGAQLMVSYPDLAPTTVWRHAPQPDPAAAQRPYPLSRSLADDGAIAEMKRIVA